MSHDFPIVMQVISFVHLHFCERDHVWVFALSLDEEVDVIKHSSRAQTHFSHAGWLVYQLGALTKDILAKYEYFLPCEIGLAVGYFGGLVSQTGYFE